MRIFCRNIIRNTLLFCAVRVIYVLPNKERRVHIMKNEIRFTLEPKQRPKLAQEIGNILRTAPHYERVPSCAYDIAGYRLDKEGVLHIPEGVAVEMVLEISLFIPDLLIIARLLETLPILLIQKQNSPLCSIYLLLYFSHYFSGLYIS